MPRTLDRIAAMLVLLLGVAHLLVGHAAFLTPTEPRIWFASAGFLLIVTGLANLAARASPTRTAVAAALVGDLSILMIGALLIRASPELGAQPQTLVLLALGTVLTVQRGRELFS